MFPFQRMALSMMPHAAMAYRCAYSCAVTYEVCCDTGFSCAISATLCAGHSEQSYGCPQLLAGGGDPVEQLAALRTQLEVRLAGVTAQERALRERQAKP